MFHTRSFRPRVRSAYGWSGLFLLCVALLGSAALAEAQVRSQRWKELRRLRYPLSIKAPTRLLFRVRRDKAGRPQLVGALQNDKNVGVPKQSLVLRLPNGKTKYFFTDNKGEFQRAAIGWPKQGSYQLRFDGNRHHAASQKQRSLDLRRVDVKVEARFPDPLPGGTREFLIDVRLLYQGHPQKGLPVTLMLQVHQAKAFGVVAKLPAALRNSLSKKAMIALMTLYTDRDGRAQFLWQGQPLQGPAEIPLSVSFPGSTYFLPQRVQSMLVITPAPASESWGSLAKTIGGAMLLLLLLGLVGWILRKNGSKQETPPFPEVQLDEIFGEVESGRVERVAHHEGFVSQIGDHTIAGVLVSLGDKKPLPGGTVTVQPLHQEEGGTRWKWQGMSNAKGHFLVECPRQGPMQVVFSHPFYQVKQMEVSLPHQNKYRLLRISLVSYRHLIFETFLLATRRVAGGQIFDPRTQTAREFLKTLHTKQQEKLEPLVKAFENAYYGSIIPTAKDYDVLRNTFHSQS